MICEGVIALRIIKHTLECNNLPIKIVPLADIHIGDANTDIKHINDIITYIKETENCYCILDGDLMNTAIAGSKSDFYGETMTPSEQLRKCVEIFKPLAERGKILAVLTGNHEERISRSVGVNLTEIMCAELGIKDLYSSTSTLLFLRFGRADNHPKQRQVYTLYINHGFGGGGRRVGSKLNSLEDLARIVSDCDCYICGHTHLPAVFRQSTYVSDKHNLAVRQQEQVFINTASALDWNNSYGDRMGFKPNSKKYPVLTLDNRKHSVRVEL